ncbi:MAG: hypothetical protein AAFV96_12235 [Pseudomonadota bacterium]
MPDGRRIDTHGTLPVRHGDGPERGPERGPEPGSGQGPDGVIVSAPDGARVGRTALPARGANPCMGDRASSRLFMASGRSICALCVNGRDH